MRHLGDPLADAAIEQVFTQSGITRLNELMRNLVTNEYPAPGTLPPPVESFFATTGTLPEWANPALLQQGEQVFWRFGPQMLLILLCYSLPFCYLDKKGVNVLALTTRLLTNPTRRVVETAQMLVDVMRPGGLTDPQGRGRRTIQKVRLMHAAVRKLAADSSSWQAEWDLPVNQEDLALTLISFSWVVIDGLEKLGFEISAEDKEAYLHSWLVVGHLLGIEQSLLPSDFASAALLKQTVARRQFASSQAGQDLTRALLDMIAYTLPGDVFRKAPRALTHHFLGDPWAGWLGVEPGTFAEALLAPLELFGVAAGAFTENPGVFRHVAQILGRQLVQAIVFVERSGNRPSFSIPAELRQTWGVNWVS
jgi:ER-bound oxygenase mpaB/B'/Rubber oxygenase, catalytic domain